MELSAILTPAPEGGYVAYNPETGTTTQGETVEEALLNLSEATEFYLEEFPLTHYARPLLTTFQVPQSRTGYVTPFAGFLEWFKDCGSVETFGAIEVEQPVTRLPPHRSRRAELPHRALQNCSLCTRRFLDS
jgi:predicted RNase H-like HicB family nuclease